MCSDVHTGVGTPHKKMCSDVHTGVGTPHKKMCSDVHTGVGTPHRIQSRLLGGWLAGWLAGWLGGSMIIVPILAPSCKLKLARFSAELRIQDGAECGNNSIIQTDSIMMLHPSFFTYVTYNKLNFDLIKVSNSRFITLCTSIHVSNV